MGRPRKFKSAKKLERLIDEYFDSCVQEVVQEDGTVKKILVRPFTITGLALSLNTTRDLLLDYKKNYEEKFSYPIKKALQRCENFAEERLYGGGQVVGAIFNLKNNYGWKDKTESELYGKDGSPLLSTLSPEETAQLQKIAAKK